MTEFLFDHPGGEEFLLQHGGQDVTAVMAADEEHVHSDVAYDMLKDYCIGKIADGSGESDKLLPAKMTPLSDSAVDLQASQRDFIDVTRPMFPQVLFGSFDVHTYVQQVHIPRHTKDSAPLFGNFLEPLTKTHWWVIPLFYAPIIAFAYSRSLRSISSEMAVTCFLAGLFNWTLIEYSLHRFVFHMDSLLPNNRIAMTLHFMTHGVHHFLPMDKCVFS
jgi:4-hydroxysphinganine ceramide fatty acyl 2-hydroxylase